MGQDTKAKPAARWALPKERSEERRMIQREQDEAKVSRIGSPAGQHRDLPYSIELWGLASGDVVERVLARAASAPLARAIFKAAQTEHPDRRITLRRGARIIADSAA